MKLSPWVLNVPQRRAIGKLCLIAEPIANLPGVGSKTIESLIGMGLVEIVPPEPNTDVHYRLTPKGDKMHEELSRLNRIPR
jgi:DNA-binding MarR family transcriptional regulator